MTLRIKVAGKDVRWQTLPEMLEGVAASTSDEKGIEIDGRFVSYRDLHVLAQRMAANLVALGIKPGDIICSLMRSRVEALATWFGAVMAGAIWTPVNTGLVGQDLAHIFHSSSPAVLVVDQDHLARLAEAGISRLPEHRYIVGAEQPIPDYADFEFLIADGPSPPSVVVGPSDPAVIIYTGGTTGMPKGVVLPHFAMIGGAMRYGEAFGASPEDRHFGVSPLFHAGGLTISVLGPMHAGMSSTIDSTFSLGNYWRRVRESRATIINPIGVILTLLCRQEPSELDRRHLVRICIGVTGQLPQDIPAEFSKRFGIEIVNIYSLSEASGAMIIYNERNSRQPESNGRSNYWADVAVVNAFDQPLQAEEIGEIVLRPKVPFSFMLRYHNNSEGTLSVLRNLWLHTGDLGYLDQDGYLFFLGREAHWLRRRGENISAYEIESIISQYPGISELAIVGVPAEIGEEEVKLFVVPEAGSKIDPVDITYWCADRMAGFKVPRFIEFVSELPRSTAKREVERHTLRAMPNVSAWDREKIFGRKLPAREQR